MVWIVVNCCKLQWHIPLLIVCRLTSCLTVTFIFCSLFPCLAVVWRHWRAFCDYVVQLTTRRLLASFWGSVTRIIAALRFVIVMVSLSLGSTLALPVVLEMVINGNWTFCWQTSSVTFCWQVISLTRQFADKTIRWHLADNSPDDALFDAVTICHLVCKSCCQWILSSANWLSANWFVSETFMKCHWHIVDMFGQLYWATR